MGKSGKTYFCNDPRLGPKTLPKKFPLLSFVSNYDRFGGETPRVFLEKWTVDGYYKYPPKNGIQLNTDGTPILGNLTLQVGTRVDRSEANMVCSTFDRGIHDDRRYCIV